MPTTSPTSIPPRDAVSALKPLAGKFAAALFATGIVGVGFLAIPTLAGSAAYVFTETFGFRHGLDEKLGRARAFYGIMGLSILLGMALTFLHIRAVDALYLTAVINGRAGARHPGGNSLGGLRPQNHAGPAQFAARGGWWWG